MSTEKPDELKQKIENLSVGEYIDSDYSELASQLDERSDAEVSGVYSDNISWREEWLIDGEKTRTVEYREGTGVMVVG